MSMCWLGVGMANGSGMRTCRADGEAPVVLTADALVGVVGLDVLGEVSFGYHVNHLT